ncbi:hypothetical protein EDC96DRAFT_542148 [Choanephora cucurbitarum]|nr:hypothetical protein EDC96DRAFT_542148 [Choanephora cucurbitarum]
MLPSIIYVEGPYKVGRLQGKPAIPTLLSLIQQMKNTSEPKTAAKVGRQRIYTNEQRKERNRKAQADFRVRRNKYTKSLESAMLQFEILIKKLKEENSKLAERAQKAEQRCNDLHAQMSLIQSLLHPVSMGNQDVQVLADTTNKNTSIGLDQTVSNSWIDPNIPIIGKLELLLEKKREEEREQVVRFSYDHIYKVLASIISFTC